MENVQYQPKSPKASVPNVKKFFDEKIKEMLHQNFLMTKFLKKKGYSTIPK